MVPGHDEPLRFLWQALNSRPVVEGPDPVLWLVPSSQDTRKLYEVDIEARICDCDGFHFKHRCSHLPVADFTARLLYEMRQGDGSAMIAGAITPENMASGPACSLSQG
jgi:hypothetical protein